MPRLSPNHLGPALALGLASAALGVAPPALAQESYATKDLKAKVLADGSEPPPDGWKVRTKLGATFAFNHNANVVGTQDGATFQIGGVLGADATYYAGQHRWENSLSLQHTQTQTPQLDRFVKSLDQLDILSTYAFRFEDPSWLGLFVRASLNTQILDGELVAVQDTEVRRIRTGANAPGGFGRATPIGGDIIPYAEGQEVLSLAQGQDAPLTGAFEPLNLRESAGVFADPVVSKPFNLSFKLGIGAQEVIAHSRGDIVVANVTDAAGRVVLVRQLEDFVFELGAEAEVDIRGEVVEQVLQYYLTVNGFYPPFTTSDIDRDFGESINLRLKAGVSLKVTKVVSLDYVLTVLRIPAVTTEFQVQNGLLIAANFDLL